MNPSTTTGMRFAAPPIINPAIPAISRPPTLARTSRASFEFGLLISKAFFFIERLFVYPCPASRDGLYVISCYGCHNGRRRCGVGNPHVASSEDIVTLYCIFICDFDPDFKGLHSLFSGHGRCPL